MANIFSSVSDYLSGGGNTNAQALFSNALNRVQNVATPDLPALADQIKQAMLAGQITPAQYQATLQQVIGKMDAAGMDTTALQADSGMNNVDTDAATLGAARGQLEQLDQLGKNNGLSDADRAQFASIIAQNDADARGQTQGTLDTLASQGQGGASGAALLARLTGGQSAANRNAAAGATVAQSAQARALDALKSALAGNTSLNQQLYSQDAAKAQAQDAVNQFNTSTKNSVAQFNATQQQAANQANFQAAQAAEAARALAQNQAAQYNATNQQDAAKANMAQQNTANALPYQAAQDNFTNTLNRENAAANAAARAGSNAQGQANNTAQGAGQLISQGINGITGLVNGAKNLFGSGDSLTGISNVGTYGLGNSIPESAASYGSGVPGYPGGAPTGWDGGFFSGVGDTLSGWGSSIGDAIGGLFSDEDLKTGKRQMTDDEVDKLMGEITAYKYRYKGPKSNPEQSGVMAQDLQKTMKDSVIDTPAGKMVQGPEMMSKALAILANNNERLRKLEGKK
jgi:hypothetical protein